MALLILGNKVLLIDRYNALLREHRGFQGNFGEAKGACLDSSVAFDRLEAGFGDGISKNYSERGESRGF